MKLILLLLRMSPRSVALAIAAGVAGGAANAALLALLNTAIARGGEPSPRLAASFLALAVLVPLAGVGSAYVMSALGQHAVLEMRLTLTRRILAAPLKRLEEVGAHRLLSTLTSDLNALVSALVRLPNVFTNLAIVGGCLLYLGWLSWPALLLSVLFLAFAVATYRAITARGMAYYQASREETDRLWKHFRAVTDGMKEIKLHAARRDAFLEGLRGTGERSKRLNMLAAVVYQAAAGWGHMVVFLAIGAVVFVLPAFVAVDIRALAGFAMILLYMVGPLTSLMETIPALGQAHVAFAHVERLGLSLEVEGGRVLPAATPPVPAPFRRLEMAGVTHSYWREKEDQGFTLGPIDLALRPGELVFVVGGNGSGKTTLAKLLVGLYAPEGGEVRVDGEAVTDANREGYLQRFSVVFADFHLFDSFLGLQSPRVDERAREHLDRLQLSHRVKVEDGRLSTVDVSQGQRKRLALLTAYLEDRPVYLFDEWAADQDPLFKDVFYRQILPELKARGKTVVVISHDDHYYGVADRVLKLDSGRIEYDGPPAGLRYGASGAPARSLAAALP